MQKTTSKTANKDISKIFLKYDFGQFIQRLPTTQNRQNGEKYNTHIFYTYFKMPNKTKTKNARTRNFQKNLTLRGRTNKTYVSI